MANNLDEIIKIQNNVTPELPAHPRNDNFVSFERGYADVKVGKNGYTADVVIGIRRSGKKVFYDLVNLDPKKIDAAPHIQATIEKPVDNANTASDTDSIPYTIDGVKRNSLKRDNSTVTPERSSNIYDYTKPFSEQLEDWKQGKIPHRDSLLVSGTPEVLKNIDFNPLPITINQRHIDYAINGTKDAGHNLGEAILKQLPEKLKEPVAVISSETHGDTSVVAILDMQHNGKSIITPVLIDGYGHLNNLRIDSNAITSVFGKDNAVTKLLNNAIKKEKSGEVAVYYMDKEKTAALLERAGLQLPGGLFRNNGYIHSINEKGSKVKPKLNNITYSLQFKRWFGDWEKHPNSSSAVVNEDGTPKVVYHGTPRGGFTRFDTFGGLSKYSMFDNSPYFTESRGIADSYMKTGIGSNPERYEAYLNIRNPIDMDAPADVKKWNKTLTQYKYDTRAEDGKTNGDVYRALEKEIESKRYQLWKAGDSAQYVVERMGYDGITHMSIEQDSGESHRVWIAFNPNQVKSAASNIGTFGLIEPDIRYSLKRDDLIPAEREANAREGQNPFDEAARISKTEENRTRMEEVWNIVKTDDDSNPFAKIDDEEQFQRYKAVLGEENMPESLDSWKDLKYNNIAAYKELQWRYKYANQPYMQSRFDYTMPNGEKNFIPEKAVIYPAVTIAGKGSDTELRAAKRLVEDYGGNIGEWRKRVGKIESSKYIFDVHWYEFNKKQYEMKLKYRKER